MLRTPFCSHLCYFVSKGSLLFAALSLPYPERVMPLGVGKLWDLKILLNLVGSVQEVNGLAIHSLTYSTHFRLNWSLFNYLLC